MTSVYVDGFSDWKSVVNQFTGASYDDEKQRDNKANGRYKSPEKVFFATYDLSEAYSGAAGVVWYDAGKYYLLQGSHCSCYGLEETGWTPEEFDSKELFLKYLEKVKYISGMKYSYDGSDPEMKKLRAAIRRHNP